MKDIYESITSRFVEQLKAGTVPWRKPWITAHPQNFVSRKPYHGINALLLGFSEYRSPYWMTFKQALEAGGCVQKGEKSFPIIYYKFLPKRDHAGNTVMNSEGQPAMVPFIRWSNVFNLEQINGVEAPAIKGQEAFQPHENAASIVAEAKLCPIRHLGNAASYLPQEDVIHSPQPNAFRDPAQYYHTLYHEMTHATGHASRLNREGVTQPVDFNSERYCKEELIAELGASFLSNEAGILNDVQFENSAAYLDVWINRLEKDPKLIVSAASQAQRSTDLILGVEQKESISETQLSPTSIQEKTEAARSRSHSHRHHFPQRQSHKSGISL